MVKKRELRTVVLAIALAFSALTWATGCSSATQKTGATALEDEARVQYYRGMEDLVDGNYTEAMNAFHTVAKSPRYVKWSALARLRVADCLYYQGKYAEAAAGYSAFINQYRGDANIPYAHYMAGHSQYAQIPMDWWLVPPSYEKDRHSLDSAAGEFNSFVTRYPKSRFLGTARKLAGELKDQQYAHMETVAKYYGERELHEAVQTRLEVALDRFPARALTAENLLQLGRAYVATDRPEDARKIYQRFVEQFADHGEVDAVRGWIRDLDGVLRSSESGETQSDSSPVTGSEASPSDARRVDGEVSKQFEATPSVEGDETSTAEDGQE